METLEDDMIEMMKKRVYDVAGCNSSLKVWLNGKRIPMKNFQDYVKLYFRSSMLEGKAMPSLVRLFIYFISCYIVGHNIENGRC
jgi:DNA topoisomerase-2